MDNSPLNDRKGVRHLGQYKPTTAYQLANEFLLTPSARVAVPYGEEGQIYLNSLYFSTLDIQIESRLREAYRQWIIFDAFVLDDHFPIYCYDTGKSGDIEAIRSDISSQSVLLDYKQIDYDNILSYFLGLDAGDGNQTTTSYADLFFIYKNLDSDLRGMIEWYVSRPFQVHCQRKRHVLARMPVFARSRYLKRNATADRGRNRGARTTRGSRRLELEV
ncbi:hypothetical protein [Paraburkholderia sp. RL17-337-BIB-A]|uniref:hypothetical protein n=1 Tax=Paraburkholderia sp. RL17-337-BIB-A TaxID=3031636 RepID=UPI0038B799DA